MNLIKFVGSMLDRICFVAGAFLAAQAPEFMQQYTQRLSGHISELNRMIGGLRQHALLSQRSLEAYIKKFLNSTDPDFAAQGTFMQESLLRLDNLQHSLHNIQESSIWLRPFVFIREVNLPIAQSTLESFQPGINLSAEGLCYALIGSLCGLLLFKLCSNSIKLIFTKKKHQSVIPAS